MKRNEIINFAKQYKSTICLDEFLKPIKIIDSLEEDNQLFVKVMSEEGNEKLLSPNDKIIPLKGRVRDRDYNYVDTTFYKNLSKNQG